MLTHYLIKNLPHFFIGVFLLVLLFLLPQKVRSEIPRPEHPKPQFVRDKWMNLNGEWDFAIDFGLSGEERGWPKDPSELKEKIMVPFCPESRLSGIEHKDFMPAVWYHRFFEIPEDWQDSRVFLHFGGVDYDCRAWVNGKLVGRHYGGSSSFSFEITEKLSNGLNRLVVCAIDDIRSFEQPAGKQSPTYFNQGCCKYTRVTGIWQTVWLEARPEKFIKNVKIIPDPDHKRFVLLPTIEANNRKLIFQATLSLPGGKKVATLKTTSSEGVPYYLTVKNMKLWSPENPFLYDLSFELYEDNRLVDRVTSYAGMRKFHIEGNKFFLNNKPIYLRFVLDQGFYPDGVWTAPSDKDLKGDIELSMAVGFNGARLHEKVFEERFHYWADQMGYLTWGEMTDWGTTFENPQTLLNLKREWREVVLRDINSPSILAWTPLNETAGRARQNPEIHRKFVSDLVDLTKALDPTRPVNDASGYVHIKTDIFTVHDYTQSIQVFQDRFSNLTPQRIDQVFIGHDHQEPELSAGYEGQPYVVDEYGGTFWIPAYTKEAPRGNGRAQWGYGKTGDQVLDLVEKLTRVILENPNISGYTYTQLTDVEQEVNGIYSFDRKLKFDQERLRNIFGAPAAVEKK